MNALLLLCVLAGAPTTPPAKASETLLVLDVKPESVVIYLDGKKLGPASKARTVKVKPGTHHIKLTLKGDQSEDLVTIKKGEKKTWSFDMTDSGAPTEKPAPPQPEPAGEAPGQTDPPREQPDPDLDQPK